ncbi:MAG TPA: TIGR04290 family methyltransferase [Thermoanaerobaculia bacterium]|jgi:tRNA (mo5U34)-methyltransferase
MTEISKASLADEITALGPWFHNLHLPDGTQTVPDHFLGDFPTFKWAQIRDHLPADLSGWTALDIGCNAGFYSFELARRGATVTGIDHDPHYLRQARWAAGQFGLGTRVRFLEMQVYDLAANAETYDLVLFMGVLYHLRYPLLGLDIVARRVRKRMIFQTLTMPGEEVCEAPADLPIDERDALLEPGWPKMAFIEYRLANDPTNWWAPNHAAVEAMLRSAGLRVLERPGHEIYVCEPGEPREETAWIEDEMRAATGRTAPRSNG